MLDANHLIPQCELDRTVACERNLLHLDLEGINLESAIQMARLPQRPSQVGLAGNRRVSGNPASDPHLEKRIDVEPLELQAQIGRKVAMKLDVTVKCDARPREMGTFCYVQVRAVGFRVSNQFALNLAVQDQIGGLQTGDDVWRLQ